MKINLYFEGVPMAIQSVRFSKSGIAYQPKKNKNWKNYIRLSAISQLPNGFITLTCPIIINKAEFVFPAPKSFNKKQREIINSGGLIPKATRPDLTDNLFKGLIDALTGVVYNDDSQIYEIKYAAKYYGKNPKIELDFEVFPFLNKVGVVDYK